MLKNRRLVLYGGAGSVLVLLVLVVVISRGSDYREQLKSGNRKERLAAISKLAAEGTEAAAEAIASVVCDPDTQVACRALQALQYLPLSDRMGPLRRALQDPRPEVRAAAMVTVGRCDEKEGAQVLAEVLEGNNPPHLRAAAAQALGRMRAWDAMPALINALEDESEQVRGRAGAAVRRMFAGRDPGFRANAPPHERARAIRVIRDCWRTVRDTERRALKQKET